MSGTERVPIKRVALIAGRIGWHGLTTDDYETVGEFLVTGTELEHGAVSWDSSHRVSTEVWERDPRIQLAEGDLLVTKDGTIGKVALVSRLPGRATLNSGVFRVTPRNHVLNPRFAFWVLSSRLFVDFIDLLSSGSTINHLYQEDFVSFGLPLPPLAAQRAITDLLDRETARIDALIVAKERMIELLAKRRDARISQIVWRSEGPTIRLKFLAALPTSGNRDHSSFTFTDAGVACLRGLNVRPGAIDRANLLRLSQADHIRHFGTRLRKGDIVIVRSGLAGAAAVVPDDLDDCNCVDLVIIRKSSHLVPAYLQYVLNSREAREQIEQRSVGALLTHFNAVDAADLSIPLRDRAQQHEVVEQLQELEGEYKRMTGLLLRQIDLLRERRQALITAAVTGQLDIPEAA